MATCQQTCICWNLCFFSLTVKLDGKRKFWHSLCLTFAFRLTDLAETSPLCRLNIRPCSVSFWVLMPLKRQIITSAAALLVSGSRCTLDGWMLFTVMLSVCKFMLITPFRCLSSAHYVTSSIQSLWCLLIWLFCFTAFCTEDKKTFFFISIIIALRRAETVFFNECCWLASTTKMTANNKR